MLTLSITRGYTMQANVAPSVDDWNAAFLPNATLDGFVGASDISEDAISFNHLGAQVFNGLNTLAALAVGDKLPVYDLSATDNAAVTVAVLINGVFSLAATAVTAFTSYTADKFTLHNGTAAVTMSPAILAEQLIAQAPALTTVDVADEVVLHDASDVDGSRAKRVTIGNILPAVGTSGVYNGVIGLDTDAVGRVTAVRTSGGSGARYDSPSSVTLPTAAGWANGVDINTGLGARPGIVQGWLICTDAGGDAGWAQNDIIPMDWVVFDTTGSTYFNGRYGLVPNGSAGVLRLFQPDNGGTGARVQNKTTGDDAAITLTKWKCLISAIR